MKKLIKIVSMLLLASTFLFLVACSSFGKIEKALQEIGYAVIETDDKAEQIEEESEVAVTTYVFSNKDSLALTEFAKINLVFVFEFKATEDMKEFYEDSSTLQGLVEDVKEDGSAEEFYDALVEKGLAKGNCLVISTNILVASEVADAIKNA